MKILRGLIFATSLLCMANVHAMFKAAVTKKVAATFVATGYVVVAAPKIKGKVERWQTHQQWKKEVAAQNQPVESAR